MGWNQWRAGIKPFANTLSTWARRAAVASMVFAASSYVGSAALGQEANTTSGPIVGSTDDGVTSWLGIPYAAPPTGELRWKPPGPAHPWTRPYQATRFAPACMQPLRNHGIAYYFGDDPISEDCLYLNVWRPSGARVGAKLPVIVYIHGGGFQAGSGSKPLYRGDKLAEAGAVVVSVNYRLGLLGFLAHPELTSESPRNASGNYGLLDQVAALRWVHENIANFGGDPSRVTLMGQSAGSISISALQISPLAKGLFHRIIAMSGSLYGGRALPSLRDAEQKGLELQSSLGASNLAQMRWTPADRIVGDNVSAGPNLDGSTIVEQPDVAYESKDFSDTPMILGIVQDEVWGPRIETLSDYLNEVRGLFPSKPTEVLKLYPATSDAEARAASLRLSHDLGFSNMMRSWAKLEVKNGKFPVYAYNFAKSQSYAQGVKFSDLNPSNTGVNHTDEVGYWLGTLDSFNIIRPTRNWTPNDRIISRELRTAAIAFAATGDPNSANNSFIWPVYGLEREEVVRIADPITVIRWPNADKLDALGALKKQRE